MNSSNSMAYIDNGLNKYINKKLGELVPPKRRVELHYLRTINGLDREEGKNTCMVSLFRSEFTPIVMYLTGVDFSTRNRNIIFDDSLVLLKMKEGYYIAKGIVLDSNLNPLIATFTKCRVDTNTNKLYHEKAIIFVKSSIFSDKTIHSWIKNKAMSLIKDDYEVRIVHRIRLFRTPKIKINPYNPDYTLTDEILQKVEAELFQE